MKESEVHALLCALFAWHLKSEETGYDSLNILARVSQGGRRRPGHKILCPEMHPDVRRVQKAFNGRMKIKRLKSGAIEKRLLT
jgi:hypothetical protein